MAIVRAHLLRLDLLSSHGGSSSNFRPLTTSFEWYRENNRSFLCEPCALSSLIYCEGRLMFVEVMESELAVICLSASFRERTLPEMADFWKHVFLDLHFSPCKASLGWLTSELVWLIFQAYS